MPGPQLIYANVCPLPIVELWGFTWAGDLAHTSKLFLNNLALITRAYIFIFICMKLTLAQILVKSEPPVHCCAQRPMLIAVCSSHHCPDYTCTEFEAWNWGLDLLTACVVEGCMYGNCGSSSAFLLAWDQTLAQNDFQKLFLMWWLRHGSSSAYRVL